MASSTAQGKTATDQENQQGGTNSFSNEEKQPKVSLPKGGGAIQGMGEKFQVNPVTGTGSLSIPIAMSPGRSGFTPQLALSYDSGAGNSPFGMGWGVGLPSISRKTQKGIPRYEEGKKSDIFLLSGVEDLVPYLDDKAPLPEAEGYTVIRYRPRIEGLFARIEKWTKDDGSTFWKSITKENITTIYGQGDEAKVFHPRDKGKTDRRVFQWLIERTFDDKGNIIFYEYKKENGENIPSPPSERNRKNQIAQNQTYLKRIYYGNTKPYVSGGINPNHLEPEWEDWLDGSHWLFELVFDYGEHFEENGGPIYEGDKAEWSCRLDPFSNFRSSFDIRTYRLCRRVLMFHHFKELGNDPYLVRSTDLEHDKNPLATKLVSVTHTSYRKNAAGIYEKAGMPKTEFRYTKPEPDFTVRELDLESLKNLPQGIDGSRFRFEDLYGEGISGVLSQSGNAWYYKPNLGNGQFGPMEAVAEIPAVANLYTSEQQLVDLDGDGQKNLVIQSRSLSGYYEIDDDGHWKNFRAFEQDPNINWGDPNLRLLDLTGDGHSDILITENDCFLWYESLAEEGFEAAERVQQALDEEAGPRIVFNDSTQSIYLADMTGDGLIDIVRISNGKICYWANQGYGQFSPKIVMDNCPSIFDNPDLFNQRNIRLSDIDGSGTTDIFYLGNGEVRYWHNESGNGWSDAHVIPNFPLVDKLSTVNVLDLLGKGTAQLVWSSSLPRAADSPLLYIDLMPEKPHLLVEINNNMGAVTKMEYSASTEYYLEHKKKGEPWITKIPFPVHVLSRTETYDAISGNSFVARYAYHHGYYDGEEREFRGFGMVEQWDTEDYRHLYEDDSFTPPGNNWSEETDVPPVYTKTWFHTGFRPGPKHISTQFAKEYFRVPQVDENEDVVIKEGKIQYEDWLLDDTILPSELSAEEELEACRALKGSLLRQEVYADDGSDKAQHPYTVTESNYMIQRLQPKGENRYAVFMVTPRESLAYHYEREPADPRIAHSANLQVDEYGNITHAASIVYPRRGTGHPAEQIRLYITCAESEILHPALEEQSWYRHSLPLSSLSFELTGMAFNGLDKIPMEDLVKAVVDQINPYDKEQEMEIIDHANIPDQDQVQKRLLQLSKIHYFDNALTQKLDYGQVHSLAIPYETYTLAFTEAILDQEELLIFQDGIKKRIITEDHLKDGGYIKMATDIFAETQDSWWIPSGKTLFYYKEEEKDGHAPAQRFYLPVGEKTPLGKVNDTTSAAQESYVYYDQHEAGATDSYYLFVEKAEDPLENTMRVVDFDYRVLQARAMEDVNNNRAEVAFDIHGMVVASAIRGKVDDNNVSMEGDELSAFQEVVCNPEDSYLQLIMECPEDYLGNATTYFHYDLFAWQRDQEPTFALGLSREQHYRELKEGAALKIQKSIVYSDGFGREVLTKVPAEAGKAPKREEDGTLIKNENGEVVYIDTGTEGYPHNRWVGNGRTLFNNKGKPVKQYEPFFDSGYGFTEEDELREWGVTPIIHYDPLTRVIRTDMPDGTFSRVEFSPWYQKTYDQNDTVLEEECRWYQDRIDGALGLEKQQAAQKAASHSDTPSITHLDSLGRPFVGIAHNRYWENYKNEKSEVNVFIPTHTFQDIEGNPLEIWDGRNCERLVDADEAITFNLRGQALNEEEDVEKHGNRVMTYRYAMGGLQLYQNSMDAGESWALVNVLGNPIHSWSYKEVDKESKEPILIHSYSLFDDLQRPTHLWIDSGAHHLLVERLVYGDGIDPARYSNLKGQLILHFDGAGLSRNKAFDFKGNLLIGDQLLADVDYVNLKNSNPDWQAVIPNWENYDLLTAAQIENLFTNINLEGLEAEAFETAITYDALNRPADATTPDHSITFYQYNEAGLLDAVWAKLPSLNGKEVEKDFVTNIDYNAKGQREAVKYGNGVKTNCQYDEKTLRLKSLYTSRKNGTEVLQNIRYYYDPVGNITEIFDEAQLTIFNINEMVEPRHRYTYDALYQLICATGRESRYNALDGHEHEDVPLLDHIPITDGEVRNYRQYYRYDPAGNMIKMQHIANGGSWTRTYEYLFNSNRLLSTTRGKGIEKQSFYGHDLHGNMTLPHLPTMTWDYKDQFVHANKNGNGELFFSYDSGRQRVRKLFHHDGGIKERIYLGGYEIYREWDAQKTQKSEELQTLHIMDDQNRICMVETTTLKDGKVPTQNDLRHFRHQLGNHLGSAAMEVDDTLDAEVITYEEYHPYGTSSFRARKSGVGVSPKRYRYTGMERDEETGLSYHGARYYLSWLGRWGACDNKGVTEGLNVYRYVRNSPQKYFDKSGNKSKSVENASWVSVDITDKETIKPDEGENNLFLIGQVYFSTDDYRLNTNKMEKIKSLAQGYSHFRISDPDFQFLLVGHADRRNTEEYNQKLALKRVLEVSSFFRKALTEDSETSLNGEKLLIGSFGKHESSKSPKERLANFRRVDIYLRITNKKPNVDKKHETPVSDQKKLKTSSSFSRKNDPPTVPFFNDLLSNFIQNSGATGFTVIGGAVGMVGAIFVDGIIWPLNIVGPKHMRGVEKMTVPAVGKATSNAIKGIWNQ